MVNSTHLKVLLKKDFLTLKRNPGFIVGFLVLPIALMAAFIAIQNLVNNGTKEGSLLEENFFYTSNIFATFQGMTGNLPFMDINPVETDPFKIRSSSLQKCLMENQNKYYYDKILIVAEDKALQQDLKTYFEEYVFKSMGFPSNWSVSVYDNQDDGFDYFKKQEKQPFCFGLTFAKFDTTNDKYDIQFHFQKQDLPDTNQPAYNKLIKAPDLASWDMYKNTGSLSVYPWITEFIARTKTGTAMDDVNPLIVTEMGYSPMSSVEFQDVPPLASAQLSQNYPFFFLIIQLIPFYYIVSKIASEREMKSREGMKMMGLEDSTYFLSWFIGYLSICVSTALLLTFMSIWIFTNVNLFLFFCFCLLYSTTLYGTAFLVVAFLPTKQSSSIAATLWHIVSYYLVFIIADSATPSTLQYGLSIFPNVCMAQIVKQIFFYNYNTGDGLAFSTLGMSYQGYSFRGGILMLIFDNILWTFLGLYLDQVVPSQFGVSKPWNFLCKSKKKAVKLGDDQQRLIDGENQNADIRNFEPVSDSLKKQEPSGECLKIRGLVKQFGPKRAVDGTNMTMYNGQIFALLGHNGAGKTTTLSMLTGLIEPTEGQAEVNGLDIFNDMASVRKDLGVCPQHDVLFEFLTPEDHLRLFAAFKGTPADKVEDQVEKMLNDIDLTVQRDQLSKTLSGGQKRKLSVAIALIGDSKVVMLDEPTSGMDTSARRRLWEMLKKNKQGRIIILTTHYMDEADILGDRIAIMAEGKVVCTGSSLFLKNRFGVGYNLVIAKKSRDPAPAIEAFIKERINNAKKMQEVSSEVSFQLPSTSSKQFKQFFEDFDQSLDDLGIRSYGVGITTLEEVFLKIGHGEELEEDQDKQMNQNQSVGGNINETKSINTELQQLEEYSISNEDPNKSHFFLHFRALLKKRFLMQRRDTKTLAIDTIFPVILIVVGLALSTVSFFKEGVAREMTPFIYTDQIEILRNQNSALINDGFGNLATMGPFQDTFIKNMNSSSISMIGNVPIELIGSPDLDIFTQIKQYDKAQFDLVHADKDAHDPFFGQFYINSLNDQFSGTMKYSGILFLNTTAPDISGAWGGWGHTIFLKHYLDAQSKLGTNFDLKFINQPFPNSVFLESLNKTIAGTNSAILMAIAWLMISDSLLVNIMKERQNQIKHQIMISGSGLLAYWMSNYVADIVFQSIPSIVGIIGVHAFGIDVPGVEYLFIVMIFANPPFVYFFTFLFDKDETGSLVLKMFYFIMGMIAPIVVSVLSVVNETTQNVANILRWFFYPVPVYSLTFGYMSIAQRTIIALASGSTEVPGSLSTQVAGLGFIFLLVSVPFYWMLVTLFEMKLIDVILCRKGQKEGDEKNPTRQSVVSAHMSHMQSADEDIAEEVSRVKKRDPKTMPVRVEDVSKKYGTVKAVNNISFGLDNGECFALLGVSGAGKTSIFKCLTGEIYPTSGQLSINGHDITTQAGFQKARKMIGYCPQFDSIFHGLTVFEHLEIYAALKGIDGSIRRKLIEKSISDMDLESYRNIRANNLSGGNKRKLSVAMAIIGNPPIIFLDEPSTGVDPQAKRFMWNIVSKISTQRKKSAVIITTHSMDEAEALSTKIGIMVDGKFKCFGSSQHIKDKFGTGYEMEVKIRTLTENDVKEILSESGLKNVNELDQNQCESILKQTDNDDMRLELVDTGIGAEFAEQWKKNKKVEADEFIRWMFTESKGNKVMDLIESKFKEFSVIEHYGSSWKLKVSRDDYSIGYLFGMMEDIQVEYDISEYAIAQTTLEQIFNNFALEAESERGMERKSSVRNRMSTKKSGRGSQIKS